ncbi:hypothetical protein J6590_023775, partial [Homalodisca vitripennis]
LTDYLYEALSFRRRILNVIVSVSAANAVFLEVLNRILLYAIISSTGAKEEIIRERKMRNTKWCLETHIELPPSQ